MMGTGRVVSAVGFSTELRWELTVDDGIEHLSSSSSLALNEGARAYKTLAHYVLYL